MNFSLVINAQEHDSNLKFRTILFDAFKINVIERYNNLKQLKLKHVVFKIRTIDDNIIRSKNDSGRIKIKGEDFMTYLKLTKVLDSYEYRNNLINRKNAKQEYVDLLLRLIIDNYQLN